MTRPRHASDHRGPRPPGHGQRWGPALAAGSGAAAVAMLLQSLIRDQWQIRTLPERVMEWLLLFVPLDLFEAGLARLGSDAKEVALAGVALGMAVALAVVGGLALRLAWSAWRLLGLGLALWLLTMVVAMPVTGAGLFGSDLLLSPVLTGAGYLAVFGGYATTLAAAALVATRARSLPPGRAPASPSRQAELPAQRRAVLAGLLGTIVAFGVARIAGREARLVAGALPPAVLPTPVPALTATADASPSGPAPAVPSASSTRPTPTPLSAPTSAPTSAIEAPPAARQLARDKDGALTAAGRQRGTLAAPITANDDFYIVTKNAAGDPALDATSWRLVVDGEVQRPIQLDYATLRALPAVTTNKTLECISNLTAQCSLTSYGCDLISTAAWRGARLRDLVDLAGGLKPGVTGFAILSVDEFSASLPLAAAMDPETLVVYEMNGDVLPREHGYPARLLVPGRYGMKNPKWLAVIRPMSRNFQGWYEQRNWNKEAVVKTMARIDVPADAAVLTPGENQAAGIAYAGTRGIAGVELSADGGQTWRATPLLEAPPGTDVMVRWHGTFVVAPGSATTLVVRATDGTGATQPEQFSLPQPDGASGRHSIQVTAG